MRTWSRAQTDAAKHHISFRRLRQNALRVPPVQPLRLGASGGPSQRTSCERDRNIITGGLFQKGTLGVSLCCLQNIQPADHREPIHRTNCSFSEEAALRGNEGKQPERGVEESLRSKVGSMRTQGFVLPLPPGSRSAAESPSPEREANGKLLIIPQPQTHRHGNRYNTETRPMTVFQMTRPHRAAPYIL